MSIIIDNFDFQNFDAQKYWYPTKGKGLKEELQNMIYSGEYLLSRKVDGNWICIIKDMEGNITTRARNKNVNGEYPSKAEWIPHIIDGFKKIPNGSVFVGEIYFPKNEQSRAVTTIMGCLKSKALERQQKGEKLHLYIFDCLALEGHNISWLPIEHRIPTASKAVEIMNNSYIRMAKYITDSDKMEDYISAVLAAGYEGVVLQRKDMPYEFGKRTAHKTLKVKKELNKEVDCFLTGSYKPSTWEYTGKELEEWQYWSNLKTNEKVFGKMYEDFLRGEPFEPITKGAFYGWAGSIEIGVIDTEGNIVSIGWISNVPEEVKQGIVEDNKNWKYKVIKITAMMMESDTKNFRHARITEWRADDDKSWQDCTYESIFGGE